MPLTRTQLGLLAKHIAGDATDPFAVGDWSGPGDLSITVDGTTGRLVLEGPGSARFAIYTAIASREKVYVYGNGTSRSDGGQLWIVAHIQDVDAGADDLVGEIATIGRVTGTGELFVLVERVAGAFGVEDRFDGLTTKSANTFYSFSLFVDGDLAEGRDFFEDVLASIVPANYFSGQVGVGVDTVRITEFEVWAAMLDRDLVVTGLSTGDTVEVQDSGGVVLASASEVSGTATLDLQAQEVTWPGPAQVVVKDSGGNVLETISPSEGVWGGDTYSFEADNPPDQPTITVGDVRRTTVALTGSTYSDPEGDPHANSQWQVDEDGEDFSSPVYDSGAVSDDLESHEATGLTGKTDYIARVRYQDDQGNWSEWSVASSSFTTEFYEACPPAASPVYASCEVIEDEGYEARVLGLEPWAYYRLEEAADSIVADDKTTNERDAVYDPDFIDAWEIDSDALGIPDKAVSFLSTLRNDPSILVDDYSRGTLTDKETDPNYVAPEFYNNFTIEVWLRCNEATELNEKMGDPPGSGHIGNELENAKWVLFPAFGGNDDHAGIGFIAGDNGISVFEHGQNHVPSRARLKGPVGQDWRHLFIIVRDDTPENTVSTSKVEIYLDGQHGNVLDDLAEWGYTEAGSNFYRQFMGHQWGRSWLSTGNGQAFDGDISEIVIWDRVLTPTEIEDLHEAGSESGTLYTSCPAPASPSYASC